MPATGTRRSVTSLTTRPGLFSPVTWTTMRLVCCVPSDSVPRSRMVYSPLASAVGSKVPAAPPPTTFGLRTCTSAGFELGQ